MLDANSQKKLIKEATAEILPIEYGTNSSFGVSLLGSGVLGANTRFITKNQSQIELEASFAPLIERDHQYYFVDPGLGVTLTGGFNQLISKKASGWKRKVTKNYIGIKAGTWINTNQNYLIAGPTYRWEGFNYSKKNKSIGFDVGFLYRVSPEPDHLRYGNGFLAFVRLDWSFYRNKT